MKSKNLFIKILMILVLFQIMGCTKEETPATTDLPSFESTSVMGDDIILGLNCFTNIKFNGDIEFSEIGFCWSANVNPTISDSKVIDTKVIDTNFDGIGLDRVTANIKGLKKDKTYYIRAYVISSAGTAYSEEIMIVTDMDGNIYQTTKIGDQIWIKEDLMNTTFRNGEKLKESSYVPEWDQLTASAYYQFGERVYYNWYVVNDIREIAPTGWHIPNDTEWNTLYNNLKNGGSEMQNKFVVTFNGLRKINASDIDNTIIQIFKYSFWWSTIEIDLNNASFQTAANDNQYLGISIGSSINKKTGLSIRCIKDL